MENPKKKREMSSFGEGKFMKVKYIIIYFIYLYRYIYMYIHQTSCPSPLPMYARTLRHFE